MKSSYLHQQRGMLYLIRTVLILSLPLFSALLLSPTMTQAETISLHHSSGITKVTTAPKKIVVFDLGALDMITLLDVQAEIALPDQSPLPHALERYRDKKYPKIGTFFEPDYESIANFAPDLIIIGGRTQPKYQELSAIAPVIDLSLNPAHYQQDLTRNVTILGKIFHKEQEAKAELDSLNHAISLFKKEMNPKTTGLIILTTGGKISAYGPGSRFGYLHDLFGIPPAHSNISIGKHGQPISPEFILSINPDWLFVIDRDSVIEAAGESARKILDNPMIAPTKAATNQHIIYLDTRNLYLADGSISGMKATLNQIDQTIKHSTTRQ